MLYACISHVPSLGIIYYRLNASLFAKTMLLSICYLCRLVSGFWHYQNSILRFESAKAVKGPIMADFVTHHCGPEVSVIEPAPWIMFFDGSSSGIGCGIVVILISPRGACFEISL